VPAYVVRVVYVPDHRPGSDLIICGSYHFDIVCIDCRACVAGIRCFCINGFDDIVLSVKQLVTYELYLHRSILELLYGKHCYVLRFLFVKGGTQGYCVHISVNIVGYSNVVHQVIAVKVEVVDL
jgi:hypothetical protein